MTTQSTRRRQLLGLIATSAGLAACGGGGGGASTPSSPAATTPATGTTTPVTTPVTTTPVTTTPTDTTPITTTPVTTPVTGTPVTTPTEPVSTTPVIAKSARRGIAYDLASAADFKALAPGVSWWYNWGTQPKIAATVDALKTAYQMDYMPMLWGAGSSVADMQKYLLANPGIKYLLLMNEPNLTDQANLLPAAAAALWPQYEALAKATGVKLVGPAITWGTLANYSDPVVWMDAFIAAYQAANGGKSPQIDYLAFHWYDYGLGGQLDRLVKYGKPFWVTEMANWHSQNDGAQIDTLAKQKTQMTDMVNTCETRSDVFRYAWFIGRMSPDPHFTSLLGADGVLTELGQLYLSLPYKA